MKTRVGCAALVLAAMAANVFGADAYFVRFFAYGRQSSVGLSAIWRDDIQFYNTGAAPVTVRFLGVSNGTAQADPPELPLPPQQVVSLNSSSQVNESWRPLPVPDMWVLHVDIPPGVVVESLDQFRVTQLVNSIPAAPRGKVSMPIFRQLVAANEAQVHLGTDLRPYGSRVNVGIYNGGADVATATIEIHRDCDNAVVESRIVSIPGNTIIQVGGLSSGDPRPCNDPFGLVGDEARYTRIIVTEPSLTFVSNLNEGITLPPAEFGAVPIVGLGIAHNEHF